MHRRLALPGLLVALAVALIAGASLAAPSTQAQTPPITWDENGVLTTPTRAIISDGGLRCLEFNAGEIVVPILNHDFDISKICTNYYIYRVRGLRVYATNSPGSEVYELTFGEMSDAAIKFSGQLFYSDGTPYAPVKVTTPLPTESSPEVVVWEGSYSAPGPVLLTGGTQMYAIWSYDPDDVSLMGSGDDDDIPPSPSSGIATRSSEYTSATISWSLIGPVVDYEIERLTAVILEVGDSARIEYGAVVRFQLPGTIPGVDSYTDTTVQANRTYQYRVRARRGPGVGDRQWSSWSDFIFTRAKPEVDVDPPSNVRLSRAHDNSEITVSWTAPVGELDNYTLQRQEMVVVEGSTIFANVVTLGGNNWIDGATTTYTDSSILPGSTYEYRLASVVDDGLGDYTAWARSSPRVTSLGGAPENLRYVDDSTARMLDDRREYRMAWDEMDGVDEYEVEVLVYQVASGEQTMEDYIVTDPSFFRTSYGRADIRVRGRKADDDLCGSGDDDYCYSEWTGWYGVKFTPKVTIEAPVAVDDTADQDIVDLRESTTEAIEASLSAAGAPVDASLVVQFLTVLAATVIGGISVALGWRLGMAPLGIGMGASIAILILFTGYRLYDVPLAWPVAIQAALAVAGMFALVRQTGVFR